MGCMFYTFITMVGGNPQRDAYGFRFWKTPGAMREFHTTGSLGRFEGVLQTIIGAAFVCVLIPSCFGKLLTSAIVSLDLNISPWLPVRQRIRGRLCPAPSPRVSCSRFSDWATSSCPYSHIPIGVFLRHRRFECWHCLPLRFAIFAQRWWTNCCSFALRHLYGSPRHHCSACTYRAHFLTQILS